MTFLHADNNIVFSSYLAASPNYLIQPEIAMLFYANVPAQDRSQIGTKEELLVLWNFLELPSNCAMEELVLNSWIDTCDFCSLVFFVSGFKSVVVVSWGCCRRNYFFLAGDIECHNNSQRCRILTGT